MANFVFLAESQNVVSQIGENLLPSRKFQLSFEKSRRCTPNLRQTGHPLTTSCTTRNYKRSKYLALKTGCEIVVTAEESGKKLRVWNKGLTDCDADGFVLALQNFGNPNAAAPPVQH